MMNLFQRLQDWRARRRTLAEVNLIPQPDLAEMSMSRSDLRDLAGMSGARIARMEIMAHLHGAAEALDTKPEIAKEVALTCARCGAVTACTHELTRSEGPRVAETGFCPNYATFLALSGDKPA